MSMTGGPRGLRGAPITKLLITSTLCITLLTELWPRVGERLLLSRASSVLLRGESWRLLTSSLLLCEDMVTAMFMGGMLYSLRLFERQMGSSKFGAFVFVGTALDVASRFAFLAIPGVGSKGVAAGPFHIIFSLLPLYFRTVPSLHPEAIRVLGISFSDKSLAYLCAMLLAGSGGLRSAWPAACGLLWGALYSWPVLPLSRMRFPRPVRQFCRAFVLPFIQTEVRAPPPGQAAINAATTGGGGAVGGGGNFAAPPAPPSGGGPRQRAAAAAYEPSPGDIQTLVDMGFGREAAEAALRAHRGDTDAAVASLVGGE